MAADELTNCPSCRRLTATIGGRCPECWYPKQASALTQRRPRPHGLSLDEWDLWDALLWSWAPVPLACVLIAVGLVLDSLPLLLVGVVVAALRFAAAAMAWRGWW